MRTEQRNHSSYNRARRASYSEERSGRVNTRMNSNASAGRSAGMSGQRGRNVAHGGIYVDGNTVRRVDYDVVREIQKQPLKRTSKETRKNREKATKMNLGQVVFLAASLCLASIILYQYLALQTANAAVAKEISGMESRLNTMRLENEEEYSRIMGSVDLEEIKERAINDLGMHYAEEGQIIEVESMTDDYVRQYMDMPKAANQ